MNKSLILLSISLSFAPFGSSLAVMGAGDIVSDPMSYSYYASQLEQGMQALKTSQQQLKTAFETKDLAQKTVKNLEGSLRRAQNAVKQIERYKERIDSEPWVFAEDVIRDPDDAKKDLERLYGKVDRSTLPTERDYNEWRELVEAETGEKLPERPNWITTKKAQTNRQVRELNNAVKKSVKADAMIGLQLEDAAELADMVNAANTQKDATDVGNALILKMISNQQQVIELLSSINRSLAISAQSELKENSKGDALNKIKSLKVDSSDYGSGESNKIGEMGKLFGGDKNWKFK